MILNHEVSHIETNATGKNTKFSVDEAGIALLIEIISSSQYKDPIRSIMIEYVQNSLDSHTQANINRPIHITLPTREYPYFEVRDFGVGLTDEQMHGFFSIIGASTKRDSNDLRGGWGLGRCVFASYYSKTMTVTTYNNKVATEYSINLKNGTGGITQLTKVTTEEENGVKISILVNTEKDLNVFYDHVQNKIYSFIDPTPIIKNIEAVKEYREISILHHSEFDKNIIKSWKVNENIVRYRRYGLTTNNHIIVMGGIVYPLHLSSINTTSKKLNSIRQKISQGLEIFCPIGSLDIVSSRDNIAYTEKTNKYLEAILERVYDLEVEQLKTDIDENNPKTTLYTTLKKYNLKHTIGYTLLGGAPYKNTIYNLDSIPPVISREIATSFTSKSTIEELKVTKEKHKDSPHTVANIDNALEKYENEWIARIYNRGDKFSKLTNHTFYQDILTCDKSIIAYGNFISSENQSYKNDCKILINYLITEGYNLLLIDHKKQITKTNFESKFQSLNFDIDIVSIDSLLDNPEFIKEKEKVKKTIADRNLAKRLAKKEPTDIISYRAITSYDGKAYYGFNHRKELSSINLNKGNNVDKYYMILEKSNFGYFYKQLNGSSRPIDHKNEWISNIEDYYKKNIKTPFIILYITNAEYLRNKSTIDSKCLMYSEFVKKIETHFYNNINIIENKYNDIAHISQNISFVSNNYTKLRTLVTINDRGWIKNPDIMNFITNVKNYINNYESIETDIREYVKAIEEKPEVIEYNPPEPQNKTLIEEYSDIESKISSIKLIDFTQINVNDDNHKKLITTIFQ